MIDFQTRPPVANASTNAAGAPPPPGGLAGLSWSDDAERAAAASATARWVAEQDALADEVARRARAAAARTAHDALEFAASSSRFPGRAERLRSTWRALSRRLPGDLGGLVRLFICVSLSMTLIAAVLPLIDRHG